MSPELKTKVHVSHIEPEEEEGSTYYGFPVHNSTFKSPWFPMKVVTVLSPLDMLTPSTARLRHVMCMHAWPSHWSPRCYAPSYTHTGGG